MPFRFYAHLSWTTWARLPLIDEAVVNFLGPFLLAEAKRHGARVMDVGIVRDHVHLLLELPPVYNAPRLVQGLKGASARLANRDGHAGRGSLRWEKGYDFRSVGIRQLAGVAAYVRDQALKHGPPQTLQTDEPFRARVVAEPALQRTDHNSPRSLDSPSGLAPSRSRRPLLRSGQAFNARVCASPSPHRSLS